MADTSDISDHTAQITKIIFTDMNNLQDLNDLHMQ